jgi:hypothetical protein
VVLLLNLPWLLFPLIITARLARGPDPFGETLAAPDAQAVAVSAQPLGIP